MWPPFILAQLEDNNGVSNWLIKAGPVYSQMPSTSLYAEVKKIQVKASN